jgi:excinuclease ABC subunit A
MIPLGVMVAVTGVSGSGKSTLVHDVICTRAWKPKASRAEICATSAIASKAICADRRLGAGGPVAHRTHTALESGDLSQGFRRHPRVVCGNPEAKKRGFSPGHFSFNIPGGRCEACQGDGTVTVEMQFLADVELICEECRGTRFKSSVLEVRYRDKNIFTKYWD